MGPAQLGEALNEALELFQQAGEMSRLQVVGELEAAFESETPPHAQAASACGSDGGAALAEGALLSFWQEQGLKASTAESLLIEMRSRGRVYSTNQLSSKLTRLRRVLPEADVASMAAKDPGLLDADINTCLLNVITLVEAFPGRDVMTLLARQPRLLLVPDMRERVPRIFNKLLELHPSGELSVVSNISGMRASSFSPVPPPPCCEK
eukprot:359944-Chlamydomonas_euryale.AAC.1